MTPMRNVDNRIAVACRAADVLPIDTLLEFQGDAKTLSKENLEKLKRSILKYGFTAPIFVWESGGDYYILDGHQRLKALLSLREEGYDIPLLPVAYIEAASEREAAEKLLYISSQYGEFSREGLDAFAFEKDIAIDDLELRLVDVEMSFSSPSEPEAPDDFDDVDDDLETDYQCPSCGYEWSGKPK